MSEQTPMACPPYVSDTSRFRRCDTTPDATECLDCWRNTALEALATKREELALLERFGLDMRLAALRLVALVKTYPPTEHYANHHMFLAVVTVENVAKRAVEFAPWLNPILAQAEEVKP